MASLASGESEASVGAGGDEVVRRKPVRERAMSSITKLLIQGKGSLAGSAVFRILHCLCGRSTGIRGFGASYEQKAMIEFGKPLTLITGQNGAGKTVSHVSMVMAGHTHMACASVDRYRVPEICYHG